MLLQLEYDDPKVLELRQKIYVDDLNLSIEMMDASYDELRKAIPDDEERFENAWKLCNVFWNNADIDKCWLVPGVALSCGVDYDEKSYRGGYLTYTLVEKRKQKKYRSLIAKEFGFLVMQCIRAIELGKEEMFMSIFEYNRRMRAQTRAFKHAGFAINAGNVIHQDLEYRGVQKVRNMDQQVFAINFDSLYEKYNSQLMELKNDETSIITSRFTDPRKYPNVVKLATIDVEPLLQEFKNFDDNENYLLTRRKEFVISPSLNAILSTYLGFRSSVYESSPMNKKNSIELKDHVGDATKKLLNQFKGAERFNYITTRKGWKTKPHTDHDDYSTQGFRVIIPLDGPMKMTFDGRREYIFKPGFAYFANVCIPHVGEHYSDLDQRTGILFKLNNDEMIWQACSSA